MSLLFYELDALQTYHSFSANLLGEQKGRCAGMLEVLNHREIQHVRTYHICHEGISLFNVVEYPSSLI